MYVCICNGVTDRRIRDAVAGGAGNFEALQDQLAVCTCCGCCEDEVREILAETPEQETAPARHLRLISNGPRTRAA